MLLIRKLQKHSGISLIQTPSGFQDVNHPMDLELYIKMGNSEQFQFSAHGSNGKLELFLNGRNLRNFVLIQWMLKNMFAVKRKLTISLREKCEIIRHIQEGMTNKEVYEKFGVPKNTISMGMKCRVFF